MASLWRLCCIVICSQVPAYCLISQTVENTIDHKGTHTELYHDPEQYLVYPRVYHISKRRRRYIDGDKKMTKDEQGSSLMVIRTKSKTFYLELQSNSMLSGIPVHIRESDKNITMQFYRDDCLKVGQILNEPGGVAAISTCSEDNTTTGILLTKSKAYILRPLSVDQSAGDEFINFTTDGGKSPPHILSLHKERSHFCGVNHNAPFQSELETDGDFPLEVNAIESVVDASNGRVKRADVNNRKVMEVAIFVDSELYDRIESASEADPRRATIRRVLGIMNQVQLIYDYASLETKLKLVVVKLEILKSNSSAPSKDKGNIDNYLDNFCNWQSKLNVRQGQPGHWDHAIMLTGLDLYKEDSGRKNAKVLGLAWVNGMCRSNYSCTLNEGSSFEAAFVIAHEMGHSLGIMHDGSGNNCDRNKFIMSDKTGPGKVNWSPCSNAYIKKFFRSGYGWCLEDDASPPNRSYDLQTRDLPGLRYSLTDQCRLALGKEYVPHQDNKDPFNNVCRELWCASGSWAKPAHPALDGSPCGLKKQCLQGLCRRERASKTRRIGAMMPYPTPSTRRSTRRTHTKDRDRDDDAFRWIDQSVLKMIKALG